MKIKYFADDTTMGSNSMENCEKYREWAGAAIKEQFPDHDVQVLNEPSITQTLTDDFESEQEIVDFCSRLWDACPWNFAEN